MLGVALASNAEATVMGALSRALGRALVFGMPGFLTFLSVAGTAAMIWVGGGIIVHGLETYGLRRHRPRHPCRRPRPRARAAAGSGRAEWVVTAAAGRASSGW